MGLLNLTGQRKGEVQGDPIGKKGWGDVSKVTSNSSFLFYETLLSLEKKSQPYPPTWPDLLRVDSAPSEVSSEFQSLSKKS
jgi:hypothetical protein